MIPNCKTAYIPEPKLTEYLLSEKHAVGRAKAKYFRSLGYNETNIAQLECDILTLAKSYDFTQKFQTPFGVKYVIEGHLLTPSGVIAKIITVWIIEPPDNRPRFVTAYPQ